VYGLIAAKLSYQGKSVPILTVLQRDEGSRLSLTADCDKQTCERLKETDFFISFFQSFCSIIYAFSPENKIFLSDRIRKYIIMYGTITIIV